MKARIPSRTKILNPQARPTIRKMLSRCSEQVMIEVFGWGGSGERLRSLESDIKKHLKSTMQNTKTAETSLPRW